MPLPDWTNPNSSPEGHPPCHRVGHGHSVNRWAGLPTLSSWLALRRNRQTGRTCRFGANRDLCWWTERALRGRSGVVLDDQSLLDGNGERDLAALGEAG